MRTYRPFHQLASISDVRALSSSSAKAFTSKESQPSTFLIFGCNTDIGKTVLTAGLIRSAAKSSTLSSSSSSSSSSQLTSRSPNDDVSIQQKNNKNYVSTHYIKPLQCGGSDEAFVRKHCQQHDDDVILLTSSTTLFRWETPSSPHLAARIENKPISDEQVVDKLRNHLDHLKNTTTMNGQGSRSSIWIETAGGVLSPSSSSPLNNSMYHSRGLKSSSSLSSSSSLEMNPREQQHDDDRQDSSSWGWIPQADLYLPLVVPPSSTTINNNTPSTTAGKSHNIQVILIGDGRLGGISATLAALESLLSRRHYKIAGIVQIRGDDTGVTSSSSSQSSSDVSYNFRDTNQEALQEYIWSMSNRYRHQHDNDEDDLDLLWKDPDSSIVSLPPLPPEPEPLTDWYNSHQVTSTLDSFVHDHLFQ